jgi:hypothetical protein
MSSYILSDSSRIPARGFFLVMLVAAMVFTLVCGTTEVKAAPAPAPAVIGLAQTTVTAVDPANMTVAITLKHREVAHTYKIDNGTRINADGVATKLANIRVGQVVTNFVERDSSALDLLEVTGRGTAPAAPAPAKPAAKK